MSVLDVSGLRVVLERDGTPVVDDISLSLDAGEILGLVGESGCGKSTVSMALMGFARRGLNIASGSVVVDGTDILALPEKGRRGLRGRAIAYIPQDPTTALNPALRLRTQMLEALTTHDVGADAKERMAMVCARLEEVGLPTSEEFLKRYPHEVSGGQAQRVAIAIAFSCRPKVLLCDEPTTGLDVSTQRHVLETIGSLTREHGVAAVYVSHDLAVVSQLAKRVAVMYAGRVIESAPVEATFEAPLHHYTSALVGAIPKLEHRTRLIALGGRAPRPSERADGCAFAARCEAADQVCLTVVPPMTQRAAAHLAACHHPIDGGPTAVKSVPVAGPTLLRQDGAALEARGIVTRYGAKTVLHEVDLAVQPGQCLAIVGESGSGKTTLSRTLAGLVAPSSGVIRLHGEELRPLSRDRTSEQHRRLQIVFQNPYASLNPRRTIGDSVAAPARHVFGISRREAREKAADALAMVSLDRAVLDTFPDQLSGGERQRAAIARALICEPEVLICDEVTSALDVSIQASIINLLIRLKDEQGLAMLFVTHNIPLVQSIADTALVLYQGRVVDTGATVELLDNPEHPYTRSLIDDTPQLEHRSRAS